MKQFDLRFLCDLNFGIGFLDLRKQKWKMINMVIRGWQWFSTARGDFEKTLQATHGRKSNEISRFNSRKIQHSYYNIEG